MPSYNYLMGLENHLSILQYAVTNLGVKSRLVFLKRKSNGNTAVRMQKLDDSEFEAEAATRKEAFALAVSTEFPAAQYPDP